MMELNFLMTFLMLFCMTKSNELRCAPGRSGEVIYVIDGAGNRRCFTIITPQSTKPMAILFFYHGTGGSAAFCGAGRGDEGKNWADYAEEQGFTLVCPEAIQYDKGGIWNIPQIITKETGTPCDSAGTLEVDYMKNIIKVLEEKKEIYDTSRIFTAGCSLGAAMSIYTSQCIRLWYPDSISSFMSHSTGLKIKGDGLPFPPDHYQPEYSWGECPKCEYFPARILPTVLHPSLKACIFDNTEDPMSQNPYFYKSSLQLEDAWKSAGNPYESHYGKGGHCLFHSFNVILNCLDDGTRRLLPNGLLPTPPPSPAPLTPLPAPSSPTEV